MLSKILLEIVHDSRYKFWVITLAAEVTSQAIIPAVTYAQGIPSFPGFSDLKKQ